MSQSVGVAERKKGGNVISGRHSLRLGFERGRSALQFRCYLLTANDEQSYAKPAKTRIGASGEPYINTLWKNCHPQS